MAFGTANRVLGNLVGETGGYLLTAAWTLLVLAALGRAFAGRWFPALGAVSAVLVLAGVLSPWTCRWWTPPTSSATSC